MTATAYLIGGHRHLCPDCTEKQMDQQEWDALCGYNVDFWPARNEWGEVMNDHQGRRLYYEIVRRDHLEPMTLEGESVEEVEDDGSFSDDGLYCADCDEELVEPFKMECGTCDTVILTGEMAQVAARMYSWDQVRCDKCYAKEVQKHTDKALAEIQRRILAGGDKWYGYSYLYDTVEQQGAIKAERVIERSNVFQTIYRDQADDVVAILAAALEDFDRELVALG